jgi:cytochrome c553
MNKLWFLLSFTIVAVVCFVVSVGCRRDMFQQPSSKPLEENTFFRDNEMGSRPIVQNTVARGELEEDEAFYTGKIGTNLVIEFPLAIDRAILERGRERYDIYCSVCHGRTGEGNGMIIQRGFPAPPSFHLERLRQAPIGHFFTVMTQGYGIMYSYATRVSPADRWSIAAYIRTLQYSRNVNVAALPQSARAKLVIPP